MPKMGKPGKALAMDEMALSACGRVALPDTPPYVVRFSTPTAGHGVPSARNDIKPCTVLMADTPSALPVGICNLTKKRKTNKNKN